MIKRILVSILGVTALMLTCTGCTKQSPVVTELEEVSATYIDPHIKEFFLYREFQGQDTNQEMMYRYSFFGTSMNDMEALRQKLKESWYETVEQGRNMLLDETGKHQGDEFILRVQKLERHTSLSLTQRMTELGNTAKEFQVKSFEVTSPEFQSKVKRSL